MIGRWRYDSRDPLAAKTARSSFLACLREAASERSDVHAAELVYGELTGNAARHAPGEVEIGLDWSEERAVLCVADVGPGFSPRARLPADELSETGRGLYLVSMLTKAMHVEHVPNDGTRIRVELSVYWRGD